MKSPYSVEAAVNRAMDRGFVEGIGITNHVHMNSPDQAHLATTRAEIDTLDPALARRVLLGAEVDIDHPSGKFVLSKDSLALVDYVIAGPHNQPHHSLLFPDLTDDERAEYFTALHDIIVTSLARNPVDVWVHPFLQEIGVGGARFEREIFDILPGILDVVDEAGIAVEISSTFHRDKDEIATNAGYDWLDSIKITSRVYQAALARPHVMFSFASDAHRLDLVGDIWTPVAIARALGIPGHRIVDLVGVTTRRREHGG